MIDHCTDPLSIDVLDVPPLADAERDRLVRALKTLGDPSRLEIFRLIAAQREPLCVCHIVERMPLQQPTISHHLRQLREAGLVTVSRRGTWAYYAADPRGIDAIQVSIDAVLDAAKEGGAAR